ncbi:MAG: hypothetical protein CMI79_06575 [Candidatus Pelagibacter sp.]|nr:hypothetical protein [Candidatus Pelagibacter sp.]|tara:strand:- start:957 stop:1679 length:723 start_codon:yes stop_codon:yes gene_type:complete
MLAIVIIGQMRSYKNIEIINSYKKYLYDNETIDLYIFTWKNVGYSNRHGNPNIHLNCNDLIDKFDIIEYYKKYDFINIKHILVEDFDIFINGLNIDLLNIYNTPFRSHSKISTCLPIEYKYQQAIRYLSNLNDIDKYSNLIITRPDICFVDYLPTLKTKLDNIYYNCICIECMDHCWYGKPRTIIKLLFNIYDDFLQNYNEITNSRDNNRDNNILLRYQCDKKNIKLNVKKKHMVKIIYI